MRRSGEGEQQYTEEHDSGRSARSASGSRPLGMQAPRLADQTGVLVRDDVGGEASEIAGGFDIGEGFATATASLEQLS